MTVCLLFFSLFKYEMEALKAGSIGALLFNAGCNEKCFLLNPEKIFGTDSSCRFREKHTKKHTYIPKIDVTEPKARILQTLITS